MSYPTTCNPISYHFDEPPTKNQPGSISDDEKGIPYSNDKSIKAATIPSDDRNVVPSVQTSQQPEAPTKSVDEEEAAFLRLIDSLFDDNNDDDDAYSKDYVSTRISSDTSISLPTSEFWDFPSEIPQPSLNNERTIKLKLSNSSCSLVSQESVDCTASSTWVRSSSFNSSFSQAQGPKPTTPKAPTTTKLTKIPPSPKPVILDLIPKQTTTAKRGDNMVNVCLVVDPVSKTVTLPPQVLEYQNLKCAIPEVKLDLPTETIEYFNQHALRTTLGINQASNLPKPHTRTDTVASTGKKTSDGASTAKKKKRKVVEGSTSDPAVPLLSSANTVVSQSNSTATDPITKNALLPPLRAMSAYNFFFRDERDRLLRNHPHCPGSNEDAVVRDLTPARAERLLRDHWGRDRRTKRQHRKTPGRLPFSELSRRISAAWRNLPEHYKDFYKAIAARDLARFQNETFDYKLQHQQQQEEEKTIATDVPNTTQSFALLDTKIVSPSPPITIPDGTLSSFPLLSFGTMDPSPPSPSFISYQRTVG